MANLILISGNENLESVLINSEFYFEKKDEMTYCFPEQSDLLDELENDLRIFLNRMKIQSYYFISE